MSVAFAEVTGSPVENYGSDGFSAQRTLIVPWDERDRFASEVLGLAGRNQATSPAIYPGKPTVVATQIRFEPISGDRPEVRKFDEISKDLNRYPKSFAKAIVYYNALPTEGIVGEMAGGAGTHFSYEIGCDSEEIEIPTAGWNWNGNPGVIPAEEPFFRWIFPITEHRITWGSVVNPPWKTIQNLQGTLNASEFLGAPPESLLFMGVQSNKLYRGDLAEGESAFTWKIRYIFRQRGLHHHLGSPGWNHLWLPMSGTWEKVTCHGNTFYDTADFQVLFEPSSE